ncbi:uncharacterized protein [Anoplolepis gracilipes]|uniref:uncharacterized protein n=1 Tax=Anoplolepis gracilipes TaxID=354296 RepID=UPI003BA341BB
MAVKDRLVEVKRKRLCIKCLRTFHGRNCKSNSCKTCKGYHNTLLHRTDLAVNEKSDKNEIQTNNTNQTTQVALASNSEESMVLNHCSVKGSTQVLLATAVIYIRDQYGNPHEYRALLDSGSQFNFMTRDMSEKLHLKPKSIHTTIMGISNTAVNTIQRIHATIESRINSCRFKVPFLVINQITERLPMFKVNKTHLHIPPNITLADPSYFIPGRIDILLGASIFWELMCSRQIRQSKNEPVLQETILGWIISGPMHIGNVKQPNQEAYCGVSLSMLQHQLENFWKIEEVKLPIQRLTEETHCEEHFLSTYQRNEEGRFVVRLPLEDTTKELEKSYKSSERRLKILERKLEREPELKECYHAFMTEYLRLGHMTEIRNSKEYKKQIYIIPHHVVRKEENTTTKVRVVFDASSKTSSGKSLNDILMVGPIIQDNLFAILIRFRQHKYAIAADITKMYRQVLVHEDDRKLQCILWRWDNEEPIRVFELNTITYGMSIIYSYSVSARDSTANETPVRKR